MNWKVLFGLLVATVIYIVAGTLMFMYVEGEARRNQRSHHGDVRDVTNMSKYLQEKFPGLTTEQYVLMVQEVVSQYESGQLQVETIEPEFDWDFPTTFFFVITTIATIGYGNITPLTAHGRALCIAYSLFGIPLMFYTLAGLGHVINDFNRRFKYSLDPSPRTTPLVFILRFLFTFIFGWICFIMLPALIFTTIEGWSYPDSIYFSFVTLTTIGFGDFSPTPKIHYGGVMQMTITIWLFLGLAWLSTTIKAMQDILNHFINDDKDIDGEDLEKSLKKLSPGASRQSSVEPEQQRLLMNMSYPYYR